MTRQVFVCVVLMLFAAAPPVFGEAAEKQVQKRVLIVSIDGLRPDVMLRADAPRLRSLLDKGAFSLYAHTTDVAITLPSHTTMVTGVPPQVHGVTWNSDLPEGKVEYPKVPTLFDIAHAAGLSTALAAGKSKFAALAQPGSVDWLYLPPGMYALVDDATVADEAIKILQDHRPIVFFVHFPAVDTAGHKYGWGSPEQLAAVHDADKALARLLDVNAAAGLDDSTLLILTADHGGSGLGHGKGDLRSHFVPFILVGPGVAKGFDMTLRKELDPGVEDVFATACDYLGLKMPASVAAVSMLQPAMEGKAGIKKVEVKSMK